MDTTEKKKVSSFRRFFSPIDLTEGNVYKVLLQFTLPILISTFFQQIYSVSDAAICGRFLSAGQVAGVGDTSSLTFIFLVFASGCNSGFSVVTAHRVGQKDWAGIRKSFASQIILGGAITVVLTLISTTCLPYMLGWINVTPENAEVYDAAYTYCFIIFLGIFSQMAYNMICCIMRSLGDSFSTLVFLIASTVFNIAMDIVCIVVFRWGVAGVAIATVFAQILSAVLSYVYAFIKYPQLRLSGADFRVKRHELGAHLSSGVPLGLQFSVLAFGIITLTAGVVKFDLLPSGEMVKGTPAQNGFSAANRLSGLFMAPINAMGTSVVNYVAQNTGSGDKKRVRKGVIASLVILAVYCAIALGGSMLLSIGGAYQHLFLSSEKITSETVLFGNRYLYAAMPLYIFLAVLVVLRSSMQGIGKSIYTLIAGVAELVARIAICLTLPVLVNGGALDATASKSAFYALCLADPSAWFLAAVVLILPAYLFIFRKEKAGKTNDRNHT